MKASDYVKEWQNTEASKGQEEAAVALAILVAEDIRAIVLARKCKIDAAYVAVIKEIRHKIDKAREKEPRIRRSTLYIALKGGFGGLFNGLVKKGDIESEKYWTNLAEIDALEERIEKQRTIKEHYNVKP